MRNKEDRMNDIMREATVVAVFGTKGGTGKTTFAVNYAMSLQDIGKKVLLIDLDLQFGDVGVFLDIPKFETISDLVTDGDFSLENVNTYLYKHKSGMQIMCAPNSPEFAELVKPEHISTIVDVLREEFDYIIFDLGPTIDETSLQAVDICNDICFIITPDISSLKNAKVCLKVLDTLGLTGKVKLILNKDGSSDIKAKDMEAALGVGMNLTIPFDAKSAIASVNRGIPIVTAAPKSKVSKVIKDFADQGSK